MACWIALAGYPLFVSLFMTRKRDEPRLLFRIIRRTKKDELRLRIEEALMIKELAPTINRREETGLDFLT